MTWRTSTWKCTGVAMIAVVACGVVPAGSVWAEQPDDPAPNVPDDSVALPELPAGEPTPEPATDRSTGSIVAVGLPPVPPSSVAEEVAVGQPPVQQSRVAEEVAVGPPAVQPSSVAEEVAVGQPPVQPSQVAEEVAVDQPPMPSAPSAALLAAVDAALDLVGDCL